MDHEGTMVEKTEPYLVFYFELLSLTFVVIVEIAGSILVEFQGKSFEGWGLVPTASP